MVAGAVKKTDAAVKERWIASDKWVGWFLIAYFFALWGFRLATRGPMGES